MSLTLKTLKIELATLGDNHPSTATTYNKMASVYKKQGDHPKALEYYGKSLKITLATLGDNHPDTAVTYYNMSVLAKKQGDNLRARKYAINARDIWRAALGPDHEDTRDAQSLVYSLPLGRQG